MSKSKQVQGEGNYEDAREYNTAQRKFVSAGEVDTAARRAKPKSEAQAQEMQRAEEAGRQSRQGRRPDHLASAADPVRVGRKYGAGPYVEWARHLFARVAFTRS